MSRPHRLPTLTAAFVLIVSIAAGSALANGGGSMSAPAPSSSGAARETSAAERARSSYNAGVKLIKRADAAREDAGKAADPGKKQKAEASAREYYLKAKDAFFESIGADSKMFEAWNYIGYCRRNLGDYKGALEAYDVALKLNPGYAEAIEYRGHAYLALRRLPEAKDAYLALFASNRTLADKLLAAMKAWVATARAASDAPDTSTLDDFEHWVDERKGLAAQTASLTRDGAAAHWN